MGGSSSKRKGSKRERELVDLLQTLGFTVIRTSASGSGGDDDLPDVTAGMRDLDLMVAIELKSTGQGATPTAYIEDHEVEALETFAYGFGAVPLCGGRFAGDREFYVDFPSNLPKTDAGSIRLKYEDLQEDALLLSEDWEFLPHGGGSLEQHFSLPAEELIANTVEV